MQKDYKYEIQVMFMRYITIEADTEKEAIDLAKDKMESLIEEDGFDKNNFSYEITDTEKYD